MFFLFFLLTLLRAVLVLEVSRSNFLDGKTDTHGTPREISFFSFQLYNYRIGQYGNIQRFANVIRLFCRILLDGISLVVRFRS